MPLDWHSLTEFGLSQNEARAYAALLELREARIMLLSSRAGLHPKNAYLSLEGLVRKGLASSRREGRSLVFAAESPLVMRRLQRERAQRLDELLPDLLKPYSATEPSRQITVLRGVDGMKARSQDLLSHGRGGTIRIVNPTESAFLKQLFYRINFRQFRLALRKNRSKLLMIDRDTAEARTRARELDRGFTDIVKRRYWPGLASAQPISWATAGDLVALAFFEEEPLYLRIVSPTVAKSFNDLFDGIWREPA